MTDATPYDVARSLRAIGIAELAGAQHHPAVQWFLMLTGFGPEEPDETAWCSAFVNFCHRLAGRAHTNSAAARSWLRMGEVIPLDDAIEGDVVIFKRGGGAQPGPEVLKAPGHVAFFVRRVPNEGGGKPAVMALGGNQSNRITLAPFSADLVLGVRRIAA